MTTAAVVLLAVALAAAATDWVAVALGRKPLEYLCKPLAVALLLGVALALEPRAGDQRTAFAVALSLSLVGDVALMLPSDRFVPGLSAFLLAHVAYVVGFAFDGGSTTDYLVGTAVAALPAVPLAIRYVGALVRRERRALVIPVAGYVVAIGAMVASAVATGNAVAIVGAVLFMASDSLIAETRFVAPRRFAPVTIIVTYHLAQVALVLSLLP